ncbi:MULTISPECIES: helix-turn-helix domain-containing protein [Actinoalloteichus]|uniref:DNA binding protein with helix-turn-helix domain n=1 Tax=Actinoalloteichus fjordicus TaxID=1612552 RepID=A0AAC9LG51_9PSEU|nr:MULTISPECIES: helix-turn-helix transcriptional regulator [Actinoalloteichus]APU17086.1 DNA binding protein with helix-turn-helix domain [Actinoalloteichus fjordicus]APU23167.1 DNA binding protein with helix-turn-helix domain [Actinoalloteichus sp. GBA129-24]
MSSRSRQTIERRQLGAELNRLRKAAGKQQKDAAAVLECDSSVISRMEGGGRPLKRLEVDALLDLYGVPAEARPEIYDLAQVARQRQPRRMHSDVMPGAFRRLSDHEAFASEIYYSEGEIIPGLLQTEDYARALIRVSRAAIGADDPIEVENLVQFRMERQELLTREDAPRLWFVIGEAALRRPLGSRTILLNQIRRLLLVIENQRTVTIQVAPLSIADHPMLGDSMAIFRFGAKAPDTVYQSTFIEGGVYLKADEDIAACIHAFDRLRAVALGPDQSREFLTRCVKELDGAS